MAKPYRTTIGRCLACCFPSPSNAVAYFPSLDTIARMAMCSKSTVLNAIAWLELYGFIDKLRRIVRTTGLLGPRVRQTSNAYVLSFPKGLGGLAGQRLPLGPRSQQLGSIRSQTVK